MTAQGTEYKNFHVSNVQQPIAQTKVFQKIVLSYVKRHRTLRITNNSKNNLQTLQRFFYEYSLIVRSAMKARIDSVVVLLSRLRGGNLDSGHRHKHLLQANSQETHSLANVTYAGNLYYYLGYHLSLIHI